MLKLSDSRNFARTLAGLGLILAPLAFLVATLVSPAWEEETGEYLNELAGNEGAHVASGLLFLLGALLFVAGMLGLIRLLRGRGVTLGQVGAALNADRSDHERRLPGPKHDRIRSGRSGR